MKNRKVSSGHDNISVRKLESEIVRSYTDLRLKKRTTANTFLQKSAQILKTYNQFFEKPQNVGDAGSFFKKSLRNYDPLNLKALESIRKTKPKSAERAKRERKQRSFYTSTSTTLAPNSDRKRQQSRIKFKEHLAEVKKEKEASKKAKEKVIAQMAEEGYDDGDPFGEVDELVAQAEEEIQEIERQNEEIGEATDDTDGEGLETDEEGEDEAEDIIETVPPPQAAGEPVESAPPPAAVIEEKDAPPAEDDDEVIYDIAKEVEECERQCMDLYNSVDELKNRVTYLLNKDDKTPEEEIELFEKKVQLNDKMLLMEQKTMKINTLLDKTKQTQKEEFNRKHSEDLLPKVIICGTRDDNVPNIIVCDHKKKKKRPGHKESEKGLPLIPQAMSCTPQFVKRLSDSYSMQERLALENADLEGKRYKLQEDLVNKDQTVENLQRKLCSLQCEYRMVMKENNLLQQKVQGVCPAGRGDFVDSINKRPPAMPCGRGRACPAEMEQRLEECSGTTQQLEKQLGDIESDVRNLQNELVAVQKERLHLEQHRRLMASPCGSPCGMPPCVPTSPCSPSPCGVPPCGAPCGGPCARPCSDVQLRELREKYNTLQDDYKSKLTEVAGLRADVEHLKKVSTTCEEQKKNCQEKLAEVEKELRGLKGGGKGSSKEMLIELEQQLSVAKKRYLEAKDEAEEAQAQLKDQENLLDEYRRKYMEAEQMVEEQRRRIDMMELEGNRINEQVNLEIQRVKNQFQEKLQELTPLPDILKATQIKLQEAQQMHLIAERNNESLVRELQSYRDKALLMADQMEKVKSDQELGAGEKVSLQSKLAEWEARYLQLSDENERLITEMTQLTMNMEDCEKRCEEKAHEIAQLTAEADNVRDEAARQVARVKDRCESVRKSMQAHISDLERQLVQSRAAARAAQKDRDEIRQKMQSQINNLNENFEDAQMRIKTLQGHVNFLKSSYTNVFSPGDLVPESVDCNCGATF